MFGFDENGFDDRAVIKVVGVGGGGGNAVDRMIKNEVNGVDFIVMNTDAQVLKRSHADNRLQLGKSITRGLGAGADPEVGKQAALESEEDIRELLRDANMVFVTCGMGGGTGTGASPIVAKIAKELGCLTVAIVTKPFNFEGSKRMEAAIEGIEKLKPHVDTMIVIPNQRLLHVSDKNVSILDSFKLADNVLRQGVQGIAEIIDVPGVINIDFADVKTVMRNKGRALMGIGVSKGNNRAVEAARSAIHSPLLETSINGATDAIVNITAATELGIIETESALEEIRNSATSNINIFWGLAINSDLGDEVIVTVIATGFTEEVQKAMDSTPKVVITETISNEVKKKTADVKISVEEDVDTKKSKFSLFNSKKKPSNNDETTVIPDWLKSNFDK